MSDAGKDAARDADDGDGFPCRVPLKVFMRPDAAAEADLLAVAEAAAGVAIAAQRQPSRNGNYVCLRLELQASSAAQLQRVRSAIGGHPDVLFGL